MKPPDPPGEKGEAPQLSENPPQENVSAKQLLPEDEPTLRAAECKPLTERDYYSLVRARLQESPLLGSGAGFWMAGAVKSSLRTMSGTLELGKHLGEFSSAIGRSNLLKWLNEKFEAGECYYLLLALDCYEKEPQEKSLSA
jgi:hypothetical protein